MQTESGKETKAGLPGLRKQPYKPPLPSMFLTNARSMAHKMDELKLYIAGNHHIRDCCIMVVSETWLHPRIPDAAVQLADHTLHRWDRNNDSGKSRGGGVCIYVHNDWSNNSIIIDSHCSPDLEFMTVKCRPFFLPRELTVVIVTAVYIPPDANVSTALALLLDAINKQLRAHPNGAHTIAGDFNQADLKTVLPHFFQHVKCPTRGDNTLDRVYTNIKHAYRAIPFPHLGQSDHLSLLLTPAYISLRRRTTPLTKTVSIWHENALSQLQDCFTHTDWEVFKHHDLAVHTEAVLAYIKYCMDNVTVNKIIRIFPNQKPWMTSQVHKLLKDRKAAFRSGDRALYSAARANLKRGIKDAKRDYKKKIEDHFTDGKSRQVWQGFQHLTNFRGSSRTAGNSSAPLAEELNHFFARFDTPQQQKNTSPQPTLDPGTPPLTVYEHEVRRVLRTVNTRKAAGPDGIPGMVLKGCADQLSGVLTNLFNLSLIQASIPSCLKSSTIIPISKKSATDSLNDYRPIALTPIIMKCFERLVLHHLKTCLPSTFDNHQFAYRANRSTEDAIAIVLHNALSHLEHQESYVRMLFIDYSSAFNTIIPDILFSKLTDLGFPLLTCTWIRNFLIDRPQTVKLGPHLSSTRTLSTGSPQGCVLSPILYSLYTHDCRPVHYQNNIIKYADDTTIVGLITKGDEAAYRNEILRLSEWCSANNLILNTTKTKEIILDFRRHKADPAPLYINRDCVERVQTFKFLGTIISADLKWSANSTLIIKKAQQRLHFLRVLKKNSLNVKLLETFYRSAVESLLTYCITVWYCSCTEAERKGIQRIINTAQRIIGCPLPTLKHLYNSRCLSRAQNIEKDHSHPGSHFFKLLPSGRRYRCIKSRTNRLKDSFFPRAIITMNTNIH